MIHYMTTNGLGNAWVGNELREVERAGIPFVLHSLRPAGTTYFRSPWADALAGRTRVLYPLPILGTALAVFVAPFVFGSRFFAAAANAFFGEREHLRARVAGLAHFVAACRWAMALRGEPVSHIHAQWIHSSGTVAMYGAWLLGVPFSFTGHATDLFRDRCALKDKVRRAAFIVCISEFHRGVYRKLGAEEPKLRLAYCGIDLSHFAPPEQPRRGARSRILASGRLVEKKGLDDLVRAFALLREQGLDVECEIAGSGPEEPALNALIAELRLTDRVRVTGQPLKQEDIPAFMHSGDIYCLPCVWARDGDVDGLPQMLMEAMACGLPAVSTRLVGIPDLIVDGQTGLLVEPRRPAELAAAIRRLVEDPGLRARLAKAGREHVCERFDISTCLEPLIQEFRARLGAAPAAPPAAAAETAAGAAA